MLAYNLLAKAEGGTLPDLYYTHFTEFDKIIEEYSDADIQHKPFIRSASDHFTLCLPDLTFTEGVKNEGLPQLEFEPVRNGSVHDKKILEYCYNSAKKAAQIAEFLGLSDSSYFRKKVLKNLVDEGYLVLSNSSGTACRPMWMRHLLTSRSYPR